MVSCLVCEGLKPASAHPLSSAFSKFLVESGSCKDDASLRCAGLCIAKKQRKGKSLSDMVPSQGPRAANAHGLVQGARRCWRLRSEKTLSSRSPGFAEN